MKYEKYKINSNHIQQWIKKIIKFGDTEIAEYEFHQYKSPI